LGIQIAVLAVLMGACAIGVIHHAGGAHLSLKPLYNPQVLTPSLIFGAMVSFGALIGFLMVHASVVAHFILRGKSRDWLRHLAMPAVGASVVLYVLFNAELNAKIAGGAWLAVGVAVLIWFRISGRSATLPVE
ncbi:MAG TPA: hypothetical protein VHZ29_13335, partial [Rhizomicrobium sp.]|nr:hypothetical protein [Rhizomicrobium sp.]